jgi:hypothetical protein
MPIRTIHQAPDVRHFTNQLLRLTLRGAGYSMFMVPYSRPPSVILKWGKITLFSAVVEKVEITYTMFADDGTPLRAKADIDFKQDDFLDDVIGAAESRPAAAIHARRASSMPGSAWIRSRLKNTATRATGGCWLKPMG